MLIVFVSISNPNPTVYVSSIYEAQNVTKSSQVCGSTSVGSLGLWAIHRRLDKAKAWQLLAPTNPQRPMHSWDEKTIWWHFALQKAIHGTYVWWIFQLLILASQRVIQIRTGELKLSQNSCQVAAKKMQPGSSDSTIHLLGFCCGFGCSLVVANPHLSPGCRLGPRADRWMGFFGWW